MNAKSFQDTATYYNMQHDFFDQVTELIETTAFRKVIWQEIIDEDNDYVFVFDHYANVIPDFKGKKSKWAYFFDNEYDELCSEVLKNLPEDCGATIYFVGMFFSPFHKKRIVILLDEKLEQPVIPLLMRLK